MDTITHEEEVPYFASRPNVTPVDPPRNRNTTPHHDMMEDSRNGSPFDISDSTHPESSHYIPISTINTTDSIDPTTADIEPPRRSKPPELPPGRCGGHCPRQYVMAIVSAACLIAVTGSVQITMKYIQQKIHENGTGIDEKFSALAERLDYGHYVTLLLFLIPSGFLAVTHPPHRLFEIGITLSSLLTVLLPTIIKLDASYVVLTIVVIFQGFLESLTWPALHSLWQYWITPTERSIIVSVSISCIYSGRFIADIIWRKLVYYDLTAFSWYFFGFAGLALAIIWHLVAREAPTKQRNRIRFNNPSNIFTRKVTYVNLNNPKLNTIPYCSMLSSASVWAIILATIGQYWVEGVFIVIAPHFLIEMNENMNEGFELLHLTLISLGTLLGGGISAALLCCTKLSVTTVRKMATSVPLFICALAIIGIQVGKNRVGMTWMCMVLAVFTLGLSKAGFETNILDIAPRFSGLLRGVNLALGWTIKVYVCRGVAQWGMASGNQRLQYDAWIIMHWVAAGVAAATSLLYALLASGDEQPWARPYKVVTSEEEGGN